MDPVDIGWWQRDEKALFHAYPDGLRSKSLCGLPVARKLVRITEKPKSYQKCSTCEKLIKRVIEASRGQN